eukprot:CAMPEP_0184656238 /NCGR_PEP_ID=MMETSP0308-20130426/16056_1 /TAXON_ID=38269 /ORGANISM="Gloeochaete witrockiana, Strain SAG 46.84" /LENGTH=70 /DNA_ID=CAMNT_0027093253 /DNA_START=13 /DNA_END=225 /DNA_ORIENTATION=+
MAKSKNHTNHNQNKKAHRNGIHKPKPQRYRALKGMDRKYLRNLKAVKRGNMKALKALKTTQTTASSSSSK